MSPTPEAFQRGVDVALGRSGGGWLHLVILIPTRMILCFHDSMISIP